MLDFFFLSLNTTCIILSTIILFASELVSYVAFSVTWKPGVFNESAGKYAVILNYLFSDYNLE